MTAEVAVMNKMAVALAADSAVTVVGENGKKVYNTVNKLFRFSASEPVGIMIYGNSELMNIPWETIIKIYIKKLGDQHFKTLREYAEQFISYLDNGNPLFPESIQEEYVFIAVSECFQFINNIIEEKVEATIYEEEELTKKKYRKIISDTINIFYKDFISRDNLVAISENHESEIIEKYEIQIKKAKEAVFGKMPISKTLVDKLIKMGGSLFSRQITFSRFTSGIVIAGFGEDEVFPSVTSYLIEGIANNKLKYIQGTESIHIAGIIPFAQHDMVYTFAEGIDPSYKEYFDKYLNDLFEGYPNLVMDCLSNQKIELPDSQKKSIVKTLQKLGDFLVNEFGKNMTEYRSAMHTKPLISSVSVLPKEELAILAESLVNLTALKQKMSMDNETVGGSIDVAVISKGDGFVWIKQKRYFNSELNPHFHC